MSKGRVEQHYLVFTATYRHESTTSTARTEDLQEAYTAKTTTLYAGGILYSKGHRQHGLRQQLRSYVTENADGVLAMHACPQCVRCGTCMQASVPACDAYVPMMHAGMRSIRLRTGDCDASVHAYHSRACLRCRRSSDA